MVRLSLLFLTGLLFAGCSQQKYTVTHWEKQPSGRNGINQVRDYHYDSGEKLFFLITNDSAGLYVHLKAVDETTRRKIVMSGLTVWIDPAAGNKKHTGVRFPLPSAGRGGAVVNNRAAGNSRRDLRAPDIRTMNQFAEMELVGFSGKNSSLIVPAKNPGEVCGSIRMSQDGNLIYLLSIPYKSLGIEYSSGMLVSLRIESGQQSDDMRQGNMAGNRPGGMGGHPGNMGGSPPGGMRSGGSPQAMQRGMQGDNTLADPIKIRLKKVKLY